DRLSVGEGLKTLARRTHDLEGRGRKTWTEGNRLTPERTRAGGPAFPVAPNDERTVRTLDVPVERGRDALGRAPGHALLRPDLELTVGRRGHLELAERAPLELRKVDEDDGVPLAQTRDPGDPRRPPAERKGVLFGVPQETWGSMSP
ncbi:MAG TPA: hypothetical protein VEY87_04160, partial [Gaiellaceae bacterium]|nr:hypothetical protein [Gaiellaceae bacterium]